MEDSITSLGPGGVLVSSHFDGEPTSYGATDAGVAVVSVLQLIAHFTAPGHQPRRGILCLLNNAEESGLFGAMAFAQSSLAHFAHTFVNLEGAGAGGRAALFRSTDMQVVKHYAHSSEPFGTVLAQDAFALGVIHSGTDFSVFKDELGLRGLDIAFLAPRARYHSVEDDARHTSIDSVWHMLSAALATVDSLAHDASNTFDGSGRDTRKRVDAGTGNAGVWFDVLGSAFAVVKLHDFFAISVALLAAGPVILLLLQAIVRSSGKWYPLTQTLTAASEESDHVVKVYGARGIFRFPLALIASSAIVVVFAFLITKVNPYIIYSSPYCVWTAMLTGWFCIEWFSLRLSDVVRPTALSRYYSLVWLYVISWLAVVVAAVGMDQSKVGGGYCLVLYNAAAFVALLISHLEMLGLYRKDVYVQHAVEESQGDAIGNEDNASVHTEQEDANESSALLGSRQTFTRSGHDSRRHSQVQDDTQRDPVSPSSHKAYGHEQDWSAHLPSWTWLLQFLVLAPINVILVGQIALLVTSSMAQTPADGGSVLNIYLIMAGLSVLLLLPLAPFMHRIKWQLPTLLLVVCVVTGIYCLSVFPFNAEARLKVQFLQKVDVDTGNNMVHLKGLDGHVQQIVKSLPSARGKNVDCDHDAYGGPSIVVCKWQGLAPNVVGLAGQASRKRNSHDRGVVSRGEENVPDMSDWIQYNITRNRNDSSINLDFEGLGSRICIVYFDIAPKHMTVDGKYKYATHEGDWRDEETRNRTKSLKLMSRRSGTVHRVNASGFFDTHGDEDAVNGYEGEKRISGRIMCGYDDVNQIGTIPAWDELMAYMPTWSIGSKWPSDNSLVEVSKEWSV